VGKLQKNESGFSVVEVVLVVVILALIGTVGWLVYKNHHKTTTAAITTTSTTKPVTSTKTTTATPVQPASTLPTGAISTTDITGSYSYPGSIFTVSYPSSWTASGVSVPTAAAQPGILPTVVTITPPNAAQGETTGITVYKSASLSNALTYAFVGNGTTVENNQSLTINGLSAMYQQNVIPGSSSGGQTKDSYAITNGTYTVVLTFETIGTPNDPGGFNATSLLPEFNAIVNSVKF
jgi:hypothetical protein